MAANTFQLFTVSALTIIAGLTMAVTGTKKKLLRWKNAPRRCPTCGRVDHHNCSCSR
jgi:hypothetical protein